MSAADLPSSRHSKYAPPAAPDEPEGALARFAARLTDLAERYIPDAFVFALLATVLVWVVALFATDTSALELMRIWGDGFWELIGFTMQMALIVITGYVVATSPPVYRASVLERIGLTPLWVAQ